MNIDQLKYIVEIAKTGSISRTAQSFLTSQSTISKSISRLEQELGVQLFIRSRGGVTPTELGAQLIIKAEEVNQKLQEFDEIVTNNHASMNQTLRLATIPMFTSILPQPLRILSQTYPTITIKMIEKNSLEIIEDIKQGIVDLGFVLLNDEIIKDKELDCRVLLETAFFVCVNKSSPLSTKSFIEPEDLLNIRIVMYTGAMLKLIQSGIQNDLPLQFSFETNNLDIIRNTIEMDSYVSILSELTINNNGYRTSDEILSIPLMLNGKQDKMVIGLVSSKSNKISSTYKELIKLIKKEIQNQKEAYSSLDD